jgi:hypothetical protein
MLDPAGQRPPRLIAGEPEALVVSAHFVVGLGWSLKISVRRQFQLWGEAATGTYDMLSTPELYDVVCSALGHELDVG